MEPNKPKIDLDKIMSNPLERKITLYCRIMGIVMIIANAFIFSPFSSKQILGGAFGVGLIFLLNPIAVSIAGRSLGIKNKNIAANLFIVLLVVAVYFGGYFFKFIFELIGVEFKNGVMPSLSIGYGIILLMLFVAFALFGARTRKKLKLIVDETIEKVKLEKLKEFAELKAKQLKEEKESKK